MMGIFLQILKSILGNTMNGILLMTVESLSKETSVIDIEDSIPGTFRPIICYQTIWKLYKSSMLLVI
jgi:hypothetical protein